MLIMDDKRTQKDTFTVNAGGTVLSLFDKGKKSQLQDFPKPDFLLKVGSVG